MNRIFSCSFRKPEAELNPSRFIRISCIIGMFLLVQIRTTSIHVHINSASMWSILRVPKNIGLVTTYEWHALLISQCMEEVSA